MTAATSGYLNISDMERVRFHMECARQYALLVQRELPIDHDAYDAVDDLLEYLGENAFQQLTILEELWKEWQEAEAVREYDAQPMRNVR